MFVIGGAFMAIEYYEIGSRLSARRKKLNMTQEMLTSLTDISANQISNIENNHCVPTIETIMKLCKALEVTPDYFLLGVKKNADSELFNPISQKIMQCTPKQQKLVYDFVSLLINENY
jgi:transcriptional regulator with XRE-family HTH domain